jgi:hypothetical protein
MSIPEPPFRRNLFEIENARNLTRDEIAATFVPTSSFWRILSSKNHIILGSRGSGKTALAKMLAHDHLSRLNDARAQQAVASKSFIGVYVPMSIEWVGGLKNKPWQTEKEAEEFFQWRLNISTCLAFLITIRSCIETYLRNKGEQARVEEDLVGQLASSWSEDSFSCTTIRALQNYLENIEHKKQQQLARLRVTGRLREGEEPVGLSFDTDLFVPLRRGVVLASRALSLPTDSTWILCLDEAEFLGSLHHRILNSYLRSASAPLVFKITTMPYFHHTLATNSGAPLDVGHDFEYVYIDQDPVVLAGAAGHEGEEFGSILFNKRAQVSGTKFKAISVKTLLGPSILLDRKSSPWDPKSSEMTLLKKYAGENTVRRAERLLTESKPAFMDQIGRKMHGALLLREAVEGQTGRDELSIYSGFSMAMRCCDANPRRLIRLFNSLLLETKWRRRGNKRIPELSAKTQTRVLMAFSTSTLVRIQSEQEYGPQLYQFVRMLGEYMHDSLHAGYLATDQVSSISIDQRITPIQWTLVRRAVALGLFYPNVSANNPDQMPEKEGVFHLAYVLAPHFRILPRRGRSRNLRLVEDYFRERHREQPETAVQQRLEFMQMTDREEEGS